MPAMQEWPCLLIYTHIHQKSHLLFHDETTFQANEDQLTLWAAKGTTLMRKGSGIMISDFIKEKGSYWH